MSPNISNEIHWDWNIRKLAAIISKTLATDKPTTHTQSTPKIHMKNVLPIDYRHLYSNNIKISCLCLKNTDNWIVTRNTRFILSRSILPLSWIKIKLHLYPSQAALFLSLSPFLLCFTCSQWIESISVYENWIVDVLI